MVVHCAQSVDRIQQLSGIWIAEQTTTRALVEAVNARRKKLHKSDAGIVVVVFLVLPDDPIPLPLPRTACQNNALLSVFFCFCFHFFNRSP